MNNQKYSVFVRKIVSKQSERKDVIKALAVRREIYAYAKRIKNNELIERTKVARSILERSEIPNFWEKLSLLVIWQMSTVKLLEPYGITAANLLHLQRIRLDETARNPRESGMAMRKGATKSMITLFRELGEVLSFIDKLVDGLIEEKPNFNRNNYLDIGAKSWLKTLKGRAT